MTESELYKNLGALTKSKDHWEENIPFVVSLLSSESTKIKAKVLWLLGEMGMKFPIAIKDSVPAIAAFCDSGEPLLRERAVNALGRIGRGCCSSVEPYWDSLFRFAHDEEAGVRLAFIWASENIATNTPDPYKDYMSLFAELLHDRDDRDDRVRMEAPEMFRVLGKRRPEFVEPYLDLLRNIAETDSNRVVRIHCLGAVKATERQ
ncbi:MAG: HEAT repeat domain-containing protein [Bacteroidales bacterium]|nr:HEAT repeat domain-containing protein [Bacteroidales bacterium]